MTKAHDAANRAQDQALQIQDRQEALGRRSRIGFVMNRKQIVALFALIALATVEDAALDSGCTGTLGTL